MSQLFAAPSRRFSQFSFCSTSLFLICFTTASLVLENWLRRIPPFGLQKLKRDKNKIYHWGMINLDENFSFHSPRFNIFFFSVVTPPLSSPTYLSRFMSNLPFLMRHPKNSLRANYCCSKCFHLILKEKYHGWILIRQLWKNLFLWTNTLRNDEITSKIKSLLSLISWVIRGRLLDLSVS